LLPISRDVQEHLLLACYKARLPTREPQARQRALALVAMCVGAMVVARAVDDPRLGDRFRDAAREHLLEATGWGEVEANNPA
jgi:hypothetical protein